MTYLEYYNQACEYLLQSKSERGNLNLSQRYHLLYKAYTRLLISLLLKAYYTETYLDHATATYLLDKCKKENHSVVLDNLDNLSEQLQRAIIAISYGEIKMSESALHIVEKQTVMVFSKISEVYFPNIPAAQIRMNSFE